MLKYSNTLDRAFHALADGTRRSILDQLSRGQASVSELAAPHAATLAAIQQHIQVLEQAELIVTEKVGRTRLCRLNSATVERIEHWLTERRLLWQDRFDRLEQLVLSDSAATHAPSRKRKPQS
jgi:DNA-binding transcriptional ArsR family regulator